jgi:hypothetical protein
MVRMAMGAVIDLHTNIQAKHFKIGKESPGIQM